MVLLCNFTLSAEPEGNLRIHFIDVEEGDSILIQTPNNNAVLIDTGNLITGYKVIKYLNRNGVDDLSYLILTHPHLDHIGGAFFILQMKNIEKVCDNGQDLTEMKKSYGIYSYYEKLARARDNYIVLKTGDRFTLDDVTFDILWPPKDLPWKDTNYNSLVIMLSFKEFRCLLAADITSDIEQKLLKENKDLKINVLKISHHGSDDASCKAFLKKTSPEISIISVANNHIHNYPSKAVLDRLTMGKTKIYRTDKDGDIILETNGQDRTKVSTENN